MTPDESDILIEMEARREIARRIRTEIADGFNQQGEGDDMTTDDIPELLTGPRVEPDRPRVCIELNCLCGATLEAATYIDSGLIKVVVTPCLRCMTGVER